MAAAFLSRINYYPFKSLDGQSVKCASLLASGALEHDRRFAIFDMTGAVINGKRTPAVHRLRCEFDALQRRVVLSRRDDGQPVGFHVDEERKQLEQWLSDYFGLETPVRVEENITGGFPDDLEAPGPTVISQATLEAVAEWFPGITVDEVRARFRANLEIGGVEPFFEDRLYAERGEVVEFAFGNAVLGGTNPCQRCIVPTRWSLTGERGPDPAFTKTFAHRRKETLPPWAEQRRFDHFYRLAVNTCSPRGEIATLRVGDPLRIIGRRPRQAAPPQ